MHQYYDNGCFLVSSVGDFSGFGYFIFIIILLLF